MATAVAAAAAPASRALDALLCRSTAALRRLLPFDSRIAALDVTPTHVSLALSDRSREAAVPFGVLARTMLPAADARILASALRRADTFDNAGSLDVRGLVVGVAPGSETTAMYVREILQASLGDDGGDEDVLFPGLTGVLFYSEAHAVERALRAHQDYMAAVEQLPIRLESRKLRRHAVAMDPKVPAEELVNDLPSRARVSASEILQAVLDDMKREQS